VFWAFRTMVGIGVLMIAVSWWLGWSMFVRKSTPSLLQLRVTSLMTFAGWIAVLAGWYVTEIGRQPWLVYGELRIEQAVRTRWRHGAVDAGNLVAAVCLRALSMSRRCGIWRKTSASLLVRADYPGLLASKEPDMEPGCRRSSRRDGLVAAAIRCARLPRPRCWPDAAFADDNEKDRMIASIGPFWDANETWIVLGVGVLLIAFRRHTASS
jgi:hypothetical protein